MARLIATLVAAAGVSLALTLFLQLGLDWPRFWAYFIGMAPLFAVGSSAAQTYKDRKDG